MHEHNSKHKAMCNFFLSLYACAHACVEIMYMETESSTSTCWSNVWPNQLGTQCFSPFPLLTSEEKEKDPGYEVVAKSLVPTSMV